MDSERWRQIEKLYHGALDLTPAERAALLAGVDSDVRRAVESLLAQEGFGLEGGARQTSGEATVTVIQTGTQLGPYKIESVLGAGGMGQVFYAIDTRLNRAVAIKTSLHPFDARFAREAQTIAQLSHPHICTLFDVGPNYLVMELVEGTTLSARLAKGALPMAQVLRNGAQIAEALAVAHDKGIVHRDLKPGNIMLAKPGVKVLDFGLAKTGNDDTLTAVDAVVGTPAYMSPEQRDGKPCDARADIYALGLVIYEMATGRRPRADEQFDSLPEKLAHVVRRCLAQDPEERWQSARDLKLEIEWVAEDTRGGAPAPRPGRIGWLWGIPTAVATMALTALVLVYLRKPVTDRVAISATISPPEKTSFDSALIASVSPDGTHVVFSATSEDGKTQLWIRRLAGSEAQPLPGTVNGKSPFWSPDGKAVGFFAGGKLKRIEISGGPPVDVCDAPNGRGGSWARDGTILLSQTAISPLSRVPASGGQPLQLTALNTKRAETGHDSPQSLPDSRHFLYHSWSVSEEFSGIYLGSLDGSDPVLLLRGISNAAFAPPDHILFSQNGVLIARHFDQSSYEVSGESVTIARLPAATDLATSLSASRNGVLAFVSGAFGAERQLEWFNRSGKSEGTVGGKGTYFTPRLSPDGSKIAVTLAPFRSPTRDIWVFDQALHRETRLTFDQLHNWTPVWSPDGSQLAYSSNPKEKFHLYVRSADGSGARQPLLEDDATEYVDSWSLDGKYVAFARMSPGGKSGWDIWGMPLFGDRRPFPIVESQSNKEDPSFSPNGKWLAYDSDESGQWEVYVVPFPRGEGKWQVSKGGGEQPRWRRDGKELFYVGTGNRLMAAEVRDKGASLDFGTEQALFPIQAPDNPYRTYDVTGDGKKFIIVTGAAGLNAKAITLIADWPVLLEHEIRLH
jgi:serine/threonine protein kinase/Tol biopolymer transport system component